MATLKIKLRTKTLHIEKYEKGENIINPLSGQSAYLIPDAVALYDWIMGINMILENSGVAGRKKVFVAATVADQPVFFGLVDVEESIVLFDEAREYFRNNWPKEYMILLD